MASHSRRLTTPGTCQFLTKTLIAGTVKVPSLNNLCGCDRPLETYLWLSHSKVLRVRNTIRQLILCSIYFSLSLIIFFLFFFFDVATFRCNLSKSYSELVSLDRRSPKKKNAKKEEMITAWLQNLCTGFKLCYLIMTGNGLVAVINQARHMVKKTRNT